MSIAIHAENLSKQYRLGPRQRYKTLRDTLMTFGRRPAPETIWALKDVSFDIHEGEVVGIIGHNGAGKSTLLKLLARITEPTTGLADVYGRIGSLLEVGTGFHPELTGRENIYLNGAILGMRRSEVDRKFDEIVAFAETEQFLDTPVKHYSSGMRVRLAFAVAAHLDPEILLVDEVLAVGDLAFQKKCLGKMNSAARSGRTVLLVSHNMQVISSCCSRVIRLDAGGVVDDGPAGATIAKYLELLLTTTTAEVLTDAKRQTASDSLRIVRVRLQNSANEKSLTMFFREPFAVTLWFEVTKPVAAARIGVTISTPTGTRICITHHTDGGAAPLQLVPGNYSVTVQLENPFVPGGYVLGVGAHDLETTRGLDWVPEAIQFHVTAASRDGGQLHDEYNAAFIYAAARWTDIVRTG